MYLITLYHWIFKILKYSKIRYFKSKPSLLIFKILYLSARIFKKRTLFAKTNVQKIQAVFRVKKQKIVHGEVGDMQHSKIGGPPTPLTSMQHMKKGQTKIYNWDARVRKAGPFHMQSLVSSPVALQLDTLQNTSHTTVMCSLTIADMVLLRLISELCDTRLITSLTDFRALWKLESK